MTLFVILAFAAVVAAMILGITSMARGGEFDRTHSTRYMAMRVGAQAAALVLIVLALLAVAR